MTKVNPKYEILLYYKYTNIESPELLRDEQKALCQKLNLKGRIIVAKEGINGTVEGLKEDTEKYIEEMEKDSRFQDINWKRSEGHGNSFPKLSVKAKNEIVMSRLGDEDVNPNELTGKYLEADELNQWFEEDRDFVIIDMRNGYEYKFGHFKNSIDPKMEYFKDLKESVKGLEKIKDKTVLTVCTGGVRCEKASGYLLKKGFKDVYQLKNGIVTYMEKYPGKNFLGSLFVFDKRQGVTFEKDHKVISKCEHCGEPAERLRNCNDKFCNARFIACKNCVDEDRTKPCPKCKKNIFKKLLGVNNFRKISKIFN